VRRLVFKYWYKDGENLIDEIEKTSLPENFVAIWSLGQASIVVKFTDIIFYFDPFLSDITDKKGISRRQFPPPFGAEQIKHANWVLCSHNHIDHMDLETLKLIALNSPKAYFVVPLPHIRILEDIGIDYSRIIGARAWKTIESPAFSITPLPSAHESYDTDENGNYLCLGYILNLSGITLYHAGDTVETEDFTDMLKRFKIDIAFLPINGADWKRRKRGTIGNMNAREAADVAVESNIDLVIPIHFDLFSGNSENPAYFVDYIVRTYPFQKFHIMRAGERFIYMK